MPTCDAAPRPSRTPRTAAGVVLSYALCRNGRSTVLMNAFQHTEQAAVIAHTCVLDVSHASCDPNRPTDPPSWDSIMNDRDSRAPRIGSKTPTTTCTRGSAAHPPSPTGASSSTLIASACRTRTHLECWRRTYRTLRYVRRRAIRATHALTAAPTCNSSSCPPTRRSSGLGSRSG